MNIILHITHRQQWEEAKQIQAYRGDTLETEGFIHCSTHQQLIKVANKFFFGQKELMILCIDSDRVQSEVKYEEADGDSFPHIYGPLNIDAVFKVIEFESGENGKFELPGEMSKIK
ncbi:MULTISPECIES: DUF952 domain-containing protein [Kamptonema]|uniref:DUF952 domain-containing protein n=1 Tax=Kamptonema TaxID=1501433 RepID=UPI0001DAD749|nr:MULTISPECIES: DUF952 domain-containing protein [Kamptonema]CBN55305.1 conserved hypothetical protein [Kamptonema sp. PCC 6506]